MLQNEPQFVFKSKRISILGPFVWFLSECPCAVVDFESNLLQRDLVRRLDFLLFLLFPDQKAPIIAISLIFDCIQHSHSVEVLKNE